jgi:hypothetical protein
MSHNTTVDTTCRVILTELSETLGFHRLLPRARPADGRQTWLDRQRLRVSDLHDRQYQSGFGRRGRERGPAPTRGNTDVKYLLGVGVNF